MGLEKSRGKRTFVNIKKGELVVKPKDGVEERFESLTGVLTGVNLKWDDFKGDRFQKLLLSITAGNETFELQMKLDSGYSRGFCFCIKNAVLTQPIKFTPRYWDKDGKQSTWLFLNQFDLPVPRAFVKDAMNGCPQLVQYSGKGGKVMWDNTAQLEFFIDMIEHEIKPNLLHPAVANSEGNEKEQHIPEPKLSDEEDDDLPF